MSKGKSGERNDNFESNRDDKGRENKGRDKDSKERDGKDRHDDDHDDHDDHDDEHDDHSGGGPNSSTGCGCIEIDRLYEEILGTEGPDNLSLNGSAFFALINGLGGNDVITGGGLFDDLQGGAGNDTVSYANTKCAVNVDLNIAGWQFTGGGLFDRLSSIENLIGSNFNDTLIGDANNNRLVGGLGADTLRGNAGNDTYSVDNVGDKVIENVGEGTDIVLSSINYTLGDNVENLALFNGAIRGTGNSVKNLMAGNDQDNILNGKGGNDTLFGGAGSDTFVFDAPDATSWDKLNDFTAGSDKLAFVGATFGIAPGAFTADYFVKTETGAVNPDGSNNLATSTTHGQFIFDRYNNLYWDSDGVGASGAILVAGLGAADLNVTDMVVI